MDHVRWEDPPYIWATPTGSWQKRTPKKEAFAVGLLALTVDGELIYPVAKALLHWARTYYWDSSVD